MRPKSLWNRELGAKTLLKLEEVIDAAELASKLDLYKEMVGHDGCVNTLRWNEAGSLLASGSDDTSIKLWDVEGNCKCTHASSHTGNIFGVEFVPGMADSYIMSGAGDGNVYLSDLERGEDISVWSSEGRVKRLASSPSTPRICWSVAEEKCVRMMDTREPRIESKFVISHMGKSMAISELHPNWIGVGTESTVVNIFDTRRLSSPLMKLSPLDKNEKDPLYVTHLTFSRQTNSLLVNFGRGSTYLFDLDESNRDSTFCRQIDQLMREDAKASGSSIAGHCISSPVNDTLEEVQSLLSHLHYSRALERLAETFKNQPDLTHFERSSLLLKRSTVYGARKWEGDSYAAARDCLSASLLAPSHPDPLARLISVLLSMEQVKLCVDMIALFKIRFPQDVDRMRPMEETLSSIPAYQRRKQNIRKNGAAQRDFTTRYTGHINENTDIKETAFFGPREEFILSASDAGYIFVYNREDSSIATVLKADSSVVNSIQPHPSLPLVASAGIDNEFSFFAPFSITSSPLTPPHSRRVTYSTAENTLARSSTRNLVRQFFMLNQFNETSENRERCQVS